MGALLSTLNKLLNVFGLSLHRANSIKQLRTELSEIQHRATSAAHVPLFVPPGHYYSPIVHIDDLAAIDRRHLRDTDVLAIDLDISKQMTLFRKLSRHFARISFPITKSKEFRYYFENNFYSYGDALILSAFIQEFAPKRIIEVGSGFSSAVILDTLDRTGAVGQSTSCVFIDPNPDRLYPLLRKGDRDRISSIESQVQEVDLKLFSKLDHNDILFLDTTHVVKTGSDVVHELFQILPRLKPGVIIHFHDVFNCFQYPDAWIFGENRSWNEIYALRAFLMYNSNFQIMLMNDFIAKQKPEEARQIAPIFMKNPGGALWLQKLSHPVAP